MKALAGKRWTIRERLRGSQSADKSWRESRRDARITGAPERERESPSSERDSCEQTIPSTERVRSGESGRPPRGSFPRSHSSLKELPRPRKTIRDQGPDQPDSPVSSLYGMKPQRAPHHRTTRTRRAARKSVGTGRGQCSKMTNCRIRTTCDIHQSRISSFYLLFSIHFNVLLFLSVSLCVSKKKEKNEGHNLVNYSYLRGGCIVTLPAKSEIQRVFRILPNAIKIWKKLTIRNVVRTLIRHINNSKKFLRIN